MLAEDRFVWANRFIYSGIIIVLIGFYLFRAMTPWCGVGNWEYQAMIARRVFSLYTGTGSLLLIFGLILRYRISRARQSEVT